VKFTTVVPFAAAVAAASSALGSERLRINRLVPVSTLELRRLSTLLLRLLSVLRPLPVLLVRVRAARRSCNSNSSLSLNVRFSTTRYFFWGDSSRRGGSYRECLADAVSANSFDLAP
jgi:hypothetical protein